MAVNRPDPETLPMTVDELCYRFTRLAGWYREWDIKTDYEMRADAVAMERAVKLLRRKYAGSDIAAA